MSSRIEDYLRAITKTPSLSFAQQAAYKALEEMQGVKDLPTAEEMIARSREVMPVGSTWLHVKSGHQYTVTCHVLIEATLTPAVVYCSAGGESPDWVRPISEFLDGRFTRMGK